MRICKARSRWKSISRVPETADESARHLCGGHLGRARGAAARIARRAACADGRARHRDDGGLAQCAGGAGGSRSGAGRWHWRATANDALAERCGKRPDRFQALAALPMQDPDAAIRELERASTSSASRARWSTASRRSAIPTTRSTTTCRSTGRSGPRSSGSACRSICIRAARCRAMRDSMTAILGCWARLGHSATRPPCMRCG